MNANRVGGRAGDNARSPLPRPTRRCFKKPAMVTQLLGADSVDTRDYHCHIGDLIRIDPYALFKVERVLVAIKGENWQIIEYGLAKLITKLPTGFTRLTPKRPKMGTGQSPSPPSGPGKDRPHRHASS